MQDRLDRLAVSSWRFHLLVIGDGFSVDTNIIILCSWEESRDKIQL